MGDGGLDLEARGQGWTLRASFDVAQGDDLSSWIAGAHVGRVQPFNVASVPPTVGLSAGIIGGELEVDVSGFGDFERAVGFQVRGDLTVPLGASTGVAFWADYRSLNFDFDVIVLSGDRKAFGSTYALGGALVMRF